MGAYVSMEHEDRTDDIAKAGMSSLFKKKGNPTEMGASTTVPWQDGNTMSSTGGPDQYAPRTPYAGKVRDALERSAPKGPSFIDAMKQGLDLGGTSVPEKVEVPKEPKADALGPEVDANETEVEPIPSGGEKVDTPVDDAVEIPEKVEIRDVPETDAEGMSTNLTDEDRAAWNERYRAEQEGEPEKAPGEPEADEAPPTDDDAFRERYGEERYAAAKNWAKLLGKGAMAVGQGVLDSDWGDDAVHAFDSTRRIVSAFLTGNPLSAASAIVGESVSNLNRMADSSEEIGRRMGIMAGANEKLLNDTIVGKLHGRKVEQDRRITNDVLMKVDDALSSLGADDITQLTSEQLDGFFDRMTAGHDEATRALKEYYAGERDLTPMEREAAYKQMKVYGQVISDIAQHSDEKKKEYARQSARLRQLNANRNRLEKQRSLALIERKRRDTTGLGRVAMEVLGDRVDLDDKGRPPERTWTRFANNLESRLNSSDLTPEQRQSYTNALSWVRHASKTPEDISRERMLAGTTDEGRFIHGLTQRGIPVNPDGSYNRSHAGTVALNAEEWISKHPDATPEQVALARKVADEAKELAKPDSRKRREQRDAEFRARYDASSPEAREIYDMMGDKAQEIVVDDQGYPNPDKARMVRNKALAQSENPALTDDQRARYEEIANKMQAYLDGPVKVARQEAEARWQSEATDWSRFMRDEIIGAKSTIAVDPRTGEVALKDKKIAAERIDGYLRKNPGLDPQMRSALEATRDKWMREREGYLDSRRSTTRRKAIFENRDLSIAERLMGGHENTPRSDTGVNGITGYSLSAQILSKDMERASQWQDENIRLDYPEVYAAMGQGMSMEDMENSQDPELKAEFDRMIHDPKFIANQHAVDNLRRMTEYKTVERRIRDVATMRGVPREEVDRDLAELRYQCYDTINRRAEDGSASEYIPPSEDGPYMDLMMDILENYGLAKPVSDGEGEQSAEGTGQSKQKRSTTRRDGGGITRNYVYTVNNVNYSPIMQYADNRNYVVDNSISMGLAQDNSTYTQNNLNVNVDMGQGAGPTAGTGKKRTSNTKRNPQNADTGATATAPPIDDGTATSPETTQVPPKQYRTEPNISMTADKTSREAMLRFNPNYKGSVWKKWDKMTPEDRLKVHEEVSNLFPDGVPTSEELDAEYESLLKEWSDNHRKRNGEPFTNIPNDVVTQLKTKVYGSTQIKTLKGALDNYHSYDPETDRVAIETRRQEEEKARADAEAKEYERRRERRVYNFDDRGGELTEEERREFNERFNGSPDPTPVDYTAEAEAYIDRIMEDIQSGNISAEDADRDLDEELQWMDEEKRAAFKDVMARRMPGYDTPEEPPETEETEVEEPQADTEFEGEKPPVTEETEVETLEPEPVEDSSGYVPSDGYTDEQLKRMPSSERQKILSQRKVEKTEFELRNALGRNSELVDLLSPEAMKELSLDDVHISSLTDNIDLTPLIPNNANSEGRFIDHLDRAQKIASGQPGTSYEDDRKFLDDMRKFAKNSLLLHRVEKQLKSKIKENDADRREKERQIELAVYGGQKQRYETLMRTLPKAFVEIHRYDYDKRDPENVDTAPRIKQPYNAGTSTWKGYNNQEFEVDPSKQKFEDISERFGFAGSVPGFETDLENLKPENYPKRIYDIQKKFADFTTGETPSDEEVIAMDNMISDFENRMEMYDSMMAKVKGELDESSEEYADIEDEVKKRIFGDLNVDSTRSFIDNRLVPYLNDLYSDDTDEESIEEPVTEEQTGDTSDATADIPTEDSQEVQPVEGAVDAKSMPGYDPDPYSSHHYDQEVLNHLAGLEFDVNDEKNQDLMEHIQSDQALIAHSMGEYGNKNLVPEYRENLMSDLMDLFDGNIGYAIYAYNRFQPDAPLPTTIPSLNRFLKEQQAKTNPKEQQAKTNPTGPSTTRRSRPTFESMYDAEDIEYYDLSEDAFNVLYSETNRNKLKKDRRGKPVDISLDDMDAISTCVRGLEYEARDNIIREYSEDLMEVLNRTYEDSFSAEKVFKELTGREPLRTMIARSSSFRDMMSSAMEDFAKTHNKTMEDHIMRDGFRPTEHS